MSQLLVFVRSAQSLTVNILFARGVRRYSMLIQMAKKSKLTPKNNEYVLT